MHEKNISKNSLIEEFFALKGTSDIHKLANMKNKIVEYLESTKPDVHLTDIVTILETIIYYIKHGDTANIFHLMSSVTNRLVATDNWDFYDVRIGLIVVGHVKGYKTVHEFAKKILVALEKYKTESFYARARFSVHYNVLARLMWSKFFELDYRKHSAKVDELTGLFKRYLDFVLSYSNDPQYSPFTAAAKVRKAIFNQDYQALEEALLFLEKETEPQAYRTAIQEVNDYFFFARSGMTRVQLNIRIGSNIRKIRQARKITLENFATMLKENQALIKNIEQGKQDAPLLILHNIAYHLGVSYDELLN